MSEKRIYYSLFIRSAGYLTLLFFGWCLTASLLNLLHYQSETQRFYGTIIFGIAMLPVLFLNWKLHISYMFSSTWFSIKHPFCPEQTIKYDDLKGWAISPGSSTRLLRLYYKDKNNDKTVKINISGKKLASELMNLIKQQYDQVMKKNLSTIKNDGFVVKLSKNKTITIKEDCLIITEPVNSKKLRWNELKDLFIKTNGMFIRFTLLFDNNKRIVFTNYMSQGGIGLTEFFNRKSKELSKKLS